MERPSDWLRTSSGNECELERAIPFVRFKRPFRQHLGMLQQLVAIAVRWCRCLIRQFLVRYSDRFELSSERDEFRAVG